MKNHQRCAGELIFKTDAILELVTQAAQENNE